MFYTVSVTSAQVASTPKIRFPEPLGRMDSQPRPLPSVVSRCILFIKVCISYHF